MVLCVLCGKKNFVFFVVKIPSPRNLWLNFLCLFAANFSVASVASVAKKIYPVILSKNLCVLRGLSGEQFQSKLYLLKGKNKKFAKFSYLL